MELSKGIALFVGWLSGALAGIGAILYACGYLLSTAQLHLLGLSGLVNYGQERYVEEGGRFLVDVLGLLGEILLNLLIGDIADTQSMPERILTDVFRDRVPDPRPIGPRHVERHEAELTRVIADQLRLLAAKQVHELWRLIPDAVEDLVSLPVSRVIDDFAFTGIDI